MISREGKDPAEGETNHISPGKRKNGERPNRCLKKIHHKKGEGRKETQREA